MPRSSYVQGQVEFNVKGNVKSMLRSSPGQVRVNGKGQLQGQIKGKVNSMSISKLRSRLKLSQAKVKVMIIAVPHH